MPALHDFFTDIENKPYHFMAGQFVRYFVDTPIEDLIEGVLKSKVHELFDNSDLNDDEVDELLLDILSMLALGVCSKKIHDYLRGCAEQESHVATYASSVATLVAACDTVVFWQYLFFAIETAEKEHQDSRRLLNKSYGVENIVNTCGTKTFIPFSATYLMHAMLHGSIVFIEMAI